MPKADDTPTTPAPYKLGRHPRRPDHYALLLADGTLQNAFAIDATRAEIAEKLARGGLVLHDDDTVTRVADAPPTRRGVLSGLALASAGLMVAAPAMAAEHPDAALLVLCADLQHVDAEIARFDGLADETRDDETMSAGAAYFPALERVLACPSPRTSEGLQAKARAAFTALKREAEPRVDDDWREEASPDVKLAMLTLRDLLGEA